MQPAAAPAYHGVASGSGVAPCTAISLNDFRNLTPASRRQDHTTSSSALALLVKSAAASTASHPNVRDDRDTPLVGDETARVLKLIWARGEWKYFLKAGLDR